MVDRITLFEPHLEGAQFGPSSMETGDPSEFTEEMKSSVDTIRDRLNVKEEASEAEAEREAEEEESTSRRGKVFKGMALFVVMFVAFWAIRSRTQQE